jgi:ABC-type polysaccharide/polyol phosphate transport system ATPase subunit
MFNNQQYLQLFRVRLNEFYLQIRDYDNKDVAMAQGMEAGLVLSAVTKSQLESLIADEHASVFGMSRLERSQEVKQEAMEVGDYAFFDTPTYQRH